MKKSSSLPWIHFVTGISVAVIGATMIWFALDRESWKMQAVLVFTVVHTNVTLEVYRRYLTALFQRDSLQSSFNELVEGISWVGKHIGQRAPDELQALIKKMVGSALSEGEK